MPDFARLHSSMFRFLCTWVQLPTCLIITKAPPRPKRLIVCGGVFASGRDDTCQHWHDLMSMSCPWGHNLVPIDPLFPFRPRSAIISHPVISLPFDIFHLFPALRIPFLLELRPNRLHVLARGLVRPANHAGGKPWDLRCRQRLLPAVKHTKSLFARFLFQSRRFFLSFVTHS
jgi:hypothetical protein